MNVLKAFKHGFATVFLSREFLWMMTFINFALVIYFTSRGFTDDPAWFGFSMLNGASGIYTLNCLIKSRKD